MKKLHGNPGLILLAAWWVCSCSAAKPPDYKNEFQAQFGFSPPSSVNNIQCSIVNIGDTRAEWLSFNCDEVTYQKILSYGFFAAKPEELKNPWNELWSQDLITQNPNAPKWWPHLTNIESMPLFYKEGQDKEFSRSYLYVWLDGSTHTVYAKDFAWQ